MSWSPASSIGTVLGGGEGTSWTQRGGVGVGGAKHLRGRRGSPTFD